MRYMNLSPRTRFNTEWVNALNVPIQNCKWVCKGCRNEYTDECKECKYYTESHTHKNIQPPNTTVNSISNEKFNAFVERMQKVVDIVEILKILDRKMQHE